MAATLGQIMSRSLLPGLALLAFLPACGAAQGGPLAFEGSYTWGSDADGPLQVVFVADGHETWGVEFEFEYHGNPQTWTGTAHGDLRSGPLEGLVNSDNPELGYVFRGEFRDGVFEGTHAERVDGVETPSGTVRFATAPPS